MSSKQLALTAARAYTLDQLLGLLDWFFFYPLLGSTAYAYGDYGWVGAFVITLPLYFIYSVSIVVFQRKCMENGVDFLGVDGLREVAKTVRPPRILGFKNPEYIVNQLKLSKISLLERRYGLFVHIVARLIEKICKRVFSQVSRLMKYVFKQLKFALISLQECQYRVFFHILGRMFGRIYKKTLSGLLHYKLLMYLVGTVIIVDPHGVFLYTQECATKKEFTKKIYTVLFAMNCWHIFCWSGIAYGAVKGVKQLVWLWEL